MIEFRVKHIPLYIVAALAFCVLLYGAFWLAKNISYTLFYNDMVKATVTEMVKREALK